MKKSIVVTLALVFVLGIAGTAFAANPFVDVPSKHWSYDAVNQLTKAGIVDGYGDGTFRGDKTMTRYEMAQIVAKALAKADKADVNNKALIDKLAVEYNAELQNLGVRVAKLEANQSKFKISGDARLRYNNPHKTTPGYTADGSERFRLNMTAAVNDNVQFNGKYMVMRHEDFGSVAKDDNQIAEASMTVKDFYGTKLILGRQSVKLGATGYYMGTTGMVDGAQVQFGNQVKVTAGYGDFTAATKDNLYTDPDRSYGIISDAYFANVDVKTSKATTISGMYIKEVAGGGLNDFDTIGLGFNSKLDKNWAIAADYTKNRAAVDSKLNPVDDRTGYVARVFYKNANKDVPHSWGLIAEYDNWEEGNYVNWNDYSSNSMLPINGRKYYALTANYTLDKNIILRGFQTINHKDAITGADKNTLTKFQLDFWF